MIGWKIRTVLKEEIRSEGFQITFHPPFLGNLKWQSAELRIESRRLNSKIHVPSHCSYNLQCDRIQLSTRERADESVLGGM